MVQLPPPPHPSRDDDDRTAALQHEAVTKFWKATLGIVLSIAVIILGWASHTPIVLGVGVIGFGLAVWTMYDAVQLNNAAESGQVESDVQDYPDNRVDTDRVSDLQTLFRDAEHHALRADVNELPTAPRSGVAGTEGFD